MTPDTRLICVQAAAKHCGIHVRKFRRMMHGLNARAQGRLLFPTAERNGRAGKFEVCVAVLDEILPSLTRRHQEPKPADEDTDARFRALTERVDVIDNRTNAHKYILRRHDKKIEKQRLALEAFGRSQRELVSGSLALATMDDE